MGIVKTKANGSKKPHIIFFDLFCLNTYSIWRSDFLAKNPQLKKLPRNFHRKFQITLAKEFLEKAQNNPQIIVGDENGPPAKKVKKIEVFVNFALNVKVCVPKSVKSVVYISAESILMSYVQNVSQSPLLNSQSA